jgi:hypothetical protein
MGQTRITIRVDEELLQKAKATAELRDETLSDVVHSAVTEYLEEYIEKAELDKFDPEWALKHDPLLSLRFTGEPTDIAGRVNEILIDAADPIEGFSLGK